MSQNLSLSLKNIYFVLWMEFVGHDVCIDGNRPAHSKHTFLKTWPPFKMARDIHSFLGFMNFCNSYIPYFEQRVESLRDLAKLDLDTEVASLMAGEHHKARKDMIMAILSDPCVARWDFNRICANCSKTAF